MQYSNKLLSILAVGLIVMALVIRVVVPPTIFVGIKSHFYHIGTIASWLVLFVGLALGIIVILRVILHGQGVR